MEGQVNSKTIFIYLAVLAMVVAGLAIGCSSAPVPNLTEAEAIGIARSYHYKHEIRGGCWATKPPPNGGLVNFSHTESASFKASGIWVVTARTEWGNMDNSNVSDIRKIASGYISDEHPCTYVVDDATGRVTQD